MTRNLVVVLLHIPVVLLQLFVGQMLGFALAWQMAIGGGWELLVMLLGSGLGVFLAGMLSLALRSRLTPTELRRRRSACLIGSLVGIGVLLLQSQLSPPPLGMGVIFLPLVGALLGFYAVDAATFFRKRRGPEQATT